MQAKPRQRRFLRWQKAALLWLLAQSHYAGAEEPYDLFHHEPESAIGEICTDRPTKSTGACTVPAGHWQYEADLINWTHSHGDGQRQDATFYASPTFKLGINTSSDVELGVTALADTITHSSDGSGSRTTGIGDMFLRYKYRFIDDEPGGHAVSLVPYIKLPTAPPGIGNKRVEGGAVMPIDMSLPYGFSVTYDPEVDILKNSRNDGSHVNYQGLVSFNHDLFVPSVTGYIEFWAAANDDPLGVTPQSSLDVALSWTMLPNLQWDAGANLGLNRHTPDVQAYLGISQRF